MDVNRDREPPSFSETTLHVRKALEGEEASLAWISDHFYPLVLSQAAYRLRRGPGLELTAEDLAAETWLTFLRRYRDGSMDLAPRDDHVTPVLLRYLSSILHNVYRHCLRTARRRRAALPPSPSSPSQAADSTSDIAARVIGGERCRAVAQALDALEPELLEILILRGVEQQPYPAIANELGLGAKAASRLYARALATLERRLPDAMVAELRAQEPSL